MSLDVKRRACGRLHRGTRGEDERERLAHARVHRGDGDPPRIHGGLELEHRVRHGSGHLERGAHGDARHVVVGAAPVGDDSALIAPLTAQDVLDQVLVLVGVAAVHEVVARHDGLGPRLANDDLEAPEVEFAQRALVNDGVTHQTARLLAVRREVLGTGREARLLDAAHVAGRHRAREVGVLGEVLEVAPAERTALDVEARAEHAAHAHGGSLLGKRVAELFAEARLPAVGHGHGRREAGGGHRPAYAEVVGIHALVAHAVGPVGEDEPRYSQRLELPGGEEAVAREQRALLREGHLPKDVFDAGRELLVCHGAS